MAVMNDCVHDRFDLIAPEYEATRRKFIPDFDTFYQSGIQFLRCEKAAPRVLDLGAGTGLYSLKLLERYPQAALTLIDFAGNMLDIARRIFSGNPGISYIQDDYSTHDFRAAKYDIVISALSIHHFDDGGKKNVYRKIYSLLDSGGEFLNADQISAGSEDLDRRYRGIHVDFVKANATEAEYSQFQENIRLDRRSPIAPQLDWLKEAGFAQADCVFKLNCFAVMYARK